MNHKTEVCDIPKEEIWELLELVISLTTQNPKPLLTHALNITTEATSLKMTMPTDMPFNDPTSRLLLYNQLLKNMGKNF